MLVSRFFGTLERMPKKVKSVTVKNFGRKKGSK
jgi:hypothetical protein